MNESLIPFTGEYRVKLLVASLQEAKIDSYDKFSPPPSDAADRASSSARPQLNQPLRHNQLLYF